MMSEVAYILARFDGLFDGWKGSRIVLHGSREYARAIIERFDADYRFEAVASQELPAGSAFCGKPVVSNEDLEKLHPDIIVMTERVRHAEAVYQEIGAMCARADIALFDMYGLDWLALREEIDGQGPLTLAEWLSITEGYDVVTLEAPGPLLMASPHRDDASLAVRPDTRQLVKLLQDRGKTVLFIGRAPYTAEQQKAAIAASDIVPGGSSIDDLFVMREGEDGSWHSIRKRYPEARILNIGHGIPKECILPRYYGASSQRVFYDGSEGAGISGTVRRIAELAAQGKRLETAAKRAIDESSLISFDLFDTLLMRKTLDPSDIFSLVELKAREKDIVAEGFASLRAEAQTLPGNADFERIYREIQPKLGVSDEDLARLQRLEFETELEMVSAREPVCNLVRYAKAQGKRVVFVSDMYYASSQLEHILEHCGIGGHDELYISCERGALKQQGLLAELLGGGMDAEEIVHFGDRIESDVEPALALGMHAILIPSVRDLAASHGYRDRMQASVALEQRLALGAELTRIFENPFVARQEEMPVVQKAELPRELRQALLEWYPFPAGERALVLGSDSEPHLSVIATHYPVVDTVLEAGSTYDCIVLLDPLMGAPSLEGLLERLSDALSPDGLLLVGFRNRFGLKYLCGGVDDAVTVPFSALEPTAGDDRVLYGRQEMAALLARAGFPDGRTYCVMPDAGFAQAVYAEDYIPAEGIGDRIVPFDAYGSPLVASERGLYDAVAQEGMLIHHANYYLRECRKPGSARSGASVIYATMSADRGRGHSFATLLFDDGTAVKRPLHPEGAEALAALASNAAELSSRGIPVVPQELRDHSLLMPIVDGVPLLAHLAAQLPEHPDALIAIIESLYSAILASSDHIPATLGICSAWHADAEELGPVLAKGFIDMIPYNAFWADGKIVFLDQEFTVPDCPAKYILFRALHYTWIHLPQAERAVPLEQLKKHFGLASLWDRFMKRENEFVGENRNWDAYRQIYDWSSVDHDAIIARRRTLASDRANDDAAGGTLYDVGLLMGVFDLFHIGHLRLIQRAKKRCRFLRVGVLGDKLAEEIKHVIPTIPLEQRMEILSAIAGVDEVVAITDSPSRLLEWERRPFDCYFSGDDHAGNEYWDRERLELRKLGAEIEFFPYTEEQSSTSIRGHLGKPADGSRADSASAQPER